MIEISKEIIHEITLNLESGASTFLNLRTSEMIAIPDFSDGGDEEYYAEMFADDLEKIKDKDFIEIPILDSNESFQIMRNFQNKIEDLKFRSQLDFILNSKKPFQNFRNLIDNSDLRETWFAYRREQLALYIREYISMNTSEDSYE